MERKSSETCLKRTQEPACAQIIVLEEREELLAALPEGEADRLKRKAFGPLALINPVLKPVGRNGARHFEGCLSVPMYGVRSLPGIKRPQIASCMLPPSQSKCCDETMQNVNVRCSRRSGCIVWPDACFDALDLLRMCSARPHCMPWLSKGMAPSA